MTTSTKDIRIKAIDLLARREHSRFELYNKLLVRGFPADETNTVLDNLAKDQLQSDARFIEAYVRMRENRGFGPLRIKAELLEKGLIERDITLVLNDESHPWIMRASDARTKKFGFELPTDPITKNKQFKFLQYRGFNSEQIKQVLTEE